MSNFVIYDDDDNIMSYEMTSYKLIKQESSILVRFETVNNSVTYELKPDTRFRTVDCIKDYLEKMLANVVANGYELKINEYLKRMYIYIGYETDEEYECGQFTATKY